MPTSSPNPLVKASRSASLALKAGCRARLLRLAQSTEETGETFGKLSHSLRRAS
jgi:hypothetical protein